MSFQPLITLSSVPRDNSSFTVVDATPTDDISGWGSPNAPSGPSAITSLFAQIQPYGGTPLNATAVTGSVSTTMTFSAMIADGVNDYLVYYGLAQELSGGFTVSADGLTISISDANLLNYMANVKAISLDGSTFPSLIASVQAGAITLISPVLVGATGASIYKYYVADVQALTLNNGEGICVNGISLLPLEADSSTNAMNIFNNLMLKLAAEIAYNCGNISKAHEAALILSGAKPLTTTNCPTCQ